MSVRSTVQSAPGTRAGVYTDVAGFLGFAERGPTQRPMRLTSFTEYRTFFGGHVRGAFLSHAVEGFFGNGGRECWVVRIATRPSGRTWAGRAEHVVELPDHLAAVDIAGGLDDDGESRPIRRRALLTAASPGPWGRLIALDARAIDAKRFSVRLSCPGCETEFREGLTFERLIASLNTDLYASRTGSTRDDVDVMRNDRASNIARARMQLVIPVPAHTLGRPDARGSSAFDLVLTFGDLGAWERPPLLAWHKRRLHVTLRRDDDVVVKRRPDLVVRTEHLPALVRSMRRRVSDDLVALDIGSSRRIPIQAGLCVHEPDDPTTSPMRPPLARADTVALSTFGWTPSTGDALLSGLEQRHFGLDDDAHDAASSDERLGLAAFDDIDEIGIVAAPDAALACGIPEPVRLAHAQIGSPTDVPLASSLLSERAPDLGALAHLPRPRDGAGFMRSVQVALLRHCARHGDRVAVLDVPPPRDGTSRDPSAWIDRLREDLRPHDAALVGSYGALYFPWLLANDPFDARRTLALPPSGHVAGVYAQVELGPGVHFAPANVAVMGCTDVAYVVDDRQHAELNDLGVNVIRPLTARGVRVMGARNLCSTPGTPRWVPTRRLLNQVVIGLQRELAWTVFEPNGPDLRREVARVARSLLIDLWRRGRLVGADETRAFHVVCDETNNSDVDSPQTLVCEVGLRPPVPAEYVVVRLVRDQDGSSVFETRRSAHA